MNNRLEQVTSKVPEVSLVFWVIKIAATTLGETAGDAVTMSMDLGYLMGTAIFAAIFIVAVSAQMMAKRFHPSYTGPWLSPQQRSGRRWPIMWIAPLALVIQAALRSC